jgi:hypothetical protein
VRQGEALGAIAIKSSMTSKINSTFLTTAMCIELLVQAIIAEVLVHQ